MQTKKIPEVDAIFDYVHNINSLADSTPGLLRLSMELQIGCEQYFLRRHLSLQELYEST